MIVHYPSLDDDDPLRTTLEHRYSRPIKDTMVIGDRIIVLFHEDGEYHPFGKEWVDLFGFDTDGNEIWTVSGKRERPVYQIGYAADGRLWLEFGYGQAAYFEPDTGALRGFDDLGKIIGELNEASNPDKAPAARQPDGWLGALVSKIFGR